MERTGRRPARGDFRVVLCWSSRTGTATRLSGGVLRLEERLDEPKPRTGVNRDRAADRGVKPDRSEGPREAEWIVSPLSGARGRWRLRHPDPLETEGGVGVPETGFRSVPTRYPLYGGRVFLG